MCQFMIESPCRMVNGQETSLWQHGNHCWIYHMFPSCALMRSDHHITSCHQVSSSSSFPGCHLSFSNLPTILGKPHNSLCQISRFFGRSPYCLTKNLATCHSLIFQIYWVSPTIPYARFQAFPIDCHVAFWKSLSFFNSDIATTKI